MKGTAKGVRVVKSKADAELSAGNCARAELNNWITNPVNLDPDFDSGEHAGWIEIMRGLADAKDIDRTWLEFRKLEPTTAIGLASYAIEAMKHASDELRRPRPSEEQRKIEHVARAARALKAAIDESPLPENTLLLRAFEYPPNRPVELEIGWRNVRIEGVFAPVIVLSEFAADIAELAGNHLEKLLPRTRSRISPKPERKELMRAFVRSLNYILNQQYGGKHSLTLIADVTNVLLPPGKDDDIGHREVQGFLKDAPAPWSALPKEALRAPLRRLR